VSFLGWKAEENGSGSYPVPDFSTSGVEVLGSAATVNVSRSMAGAGVTALEAVRVGHSSPQARCR
jgi:hypothetical protein